MNKNLSNEFKVGQVWQYDTRKGEEKSLLYIVHIDEEESPAKIYHIYIDNLAIKNPYQESGIQYELPHAPVDEETLTNSITNLVSENSPMPNISNGYSSWRNAFDKGEAGVFNIPVKKIVQYIEEIIENAVN